MLSLCSFSAFLFIFLKSVYSWFPPPYSLHYDWQGHSAHFSLVVWPHSTFFETSFSFSNRSLIVIYRLHPNLWEPKVKWILKHVPEFSVLGYTFCFLFFHNVLVYQMLWCCTQRFAFHYNNSFHEPKMGSHLNYITSVH